MWKGWGIKLEDNTSAFARRVVKHLREHASLSKPAALKPEGKYKDHR